MHAETGYKKIQGFCLLLACATGCKYMRQPARSGFSVPDDRIPTVS